MENIRVTFATIHMAENVIIIIIIIITTTQYQPSDIWGNPWTSPGAGGLHWAATHQEVASGPGESGTLRRWGKSSRDLTHV